MILGVSILKIKRQTGGVGQAVFGEGRKKRGKNGHDIFGETISLGDESGGQPADY